MSECVVKITKPLVCITKDGYYGNCQMDRVWCIQRNAPKGITMGEAYAAMTDKVPSWCPIICQLPEGHGRLGDLDELAAGCDSPHWCRWLSEIEDAPTIVPAEAERKVDAPDAVTPTDTPTDTPTVPAERSEHEAD